MTEKQSKSKENKMEKIDTIKRAFKGSIEKWEKIVEGTGLDLASGNCPLCQKTNGCSNCPIGGEDGFNCDSTPYETWINHFKKVHFLYKGEKRVLCEVCRKIAEDEVEFLKGELKNYISYNEFKKNNIGDRFIVNDEKSYFHKSKFILANPEHDAVVLIDLKDGRRWSDLVKIKNENNITKKEWDLITDNTKFDRIRK